MQARIPRRHYLRRHRRSHPAQNGNCRNELLLPGILSVDAKDREIGTFPLHGEKLQ
jgi:hypothetical protein